MFNPHTPTDPSLRPPMWATGAIDLEQGIGLLTQLPGTNLITNRRWRGGEGSPVGRRVGGGSSVEFCHDTREALFAVTSWSDPHDVVVPLNETAACFCAPEASQVTGVRGLAVCIPLDAQARAAFPRDPDKATEEFLKRVVQPLYIRALLANTRPIYICDAPNGCAWMVFLSKRTISLLTEQARETYREAAQRLAEFLGGNTGGDPVTVLLPVPGVAWVRDNITRANVWAYDICGATPDARASNGSTLPELISLIDRIEKIPPVTPENFPLEEGARDLAAELAKRGINL